MAAEAGAPGEPAGTAADDPRCPRCGGGFHCGVNDPQPCACTTLRLSAETLAELRARYTGCLCLACLAQLADPEPNTGARPRPRWRPRSTAMKAKRRRTLRLLVIGTGLALLAALAGFGAHELATWLMDLVLAWAEPRAPRLALACTGEC
ncbi:MAG TPA: cysteine-rich CWC family protein [Burkholderiaceae bacterium]|nr:cysteine-rich CWC family protein [Burkholderiaceae bacterium]